MLKGININETVEYVSKLDKGDNPTKFVIGVLKHEDKLNIFGDAINEKGEVDMQKILKEKLVIVVRTGLKGIKNFDGVDYSKEQITSDLIDSIEFNVLSELLEQILALNFPSEQERKN